MYFYIPTKPQQTSSELPRAVALHQAGMLDQAEQLYQIILGHRPEDADALNLFGLLKYQQGQAIEAVNLFERAIALNPHVADFHSNLGMAYRALGNLERAIGQYLQGLELAPRHKGLLYNLGNAYQESGRAELAGLSYEQALQIDPGFVEAHYNLGNALRATGRLSDAMASYGQALHLEPLHAGAHNNLGNVHLDRGDFAAAITCYRRVLSINPEQSPRNRPLDHAGAHSNILNGLNYDPSVTQEQLFREHVAWDVAYGRPLHALPFSDAQTAQPGRPLRIGYVSGDLCRHTVSYYFLPIISCHDPRNFEIYCYSTRGVVDDMTRKLIGLAGHWRSLVGINDLAAAQMIRADAIDILVDLSGHTAHNRLPIFGYRPAPVQASWLGYFNTTGMSSIDHILMDEYAVPLGQEVWFTENVIRLPWGRFCYAPPDYAPAVAPSPHTKTGVITFGSFNNLSKVTAQVIGLWSELLRLLPRSRLLLKWSTLADPLERQRLGAMFQAQGMEPGRVELRGPSPHPRMLEEYGDIDIALDPFPFSGGVTSCEALWMGVPVVTWPGERPVSRQTLGFLSALNLPELCARSPQEYLEIALVLAQDSPRLAGLRSGLRQRMAASPLCDGPRFTRALEDTLRSLWTNWCQRQAGT